MTVQKYDLAKARDLMKKFGLSNVLSITKAATVVGIALPGACALMEKESGGKNVFGHDAGGALAGFPGSVTKGSYEVFRWLVFDQGQTPNGVGPAQITSRGLLLDMENQGLRPWIAQDNMQYGFSLLWRYHEEAVAGGSQQPWVVAGTRYNGSSAYGVDLAGKRAAWASRLTSAEVA